MRISISGNIFNTIEEAIAGARNSGYTGLEVRPTEGHMPSNTSDARGREIRSLLQEAGLTVPCIASFVGGYNTKSDKECAREIVEFEKFLKLAQKIDCGIVRQLVGGPRPAEATEKDMVKIVRWLRRSSDIADSYGARIAIEMHAYHITEGVGSSLKLLDMLNRDNVGLIFEPGNMYIVDEPQGYESVKRLGDAIIHAHIKDIRKSHADAEWEPCIIGEGEVQLLSAFRGLKEIGYNGFLTVESAVTAKKGEELARLEYDGITRLMGRI